MSPTEMPNPELREQQVEVDGARIHVGSAGAGADAVVLSGGPGMVHYLERADLVPEGVRCWFPEPRGVGRSTGAPHDMARAIADLEAVRRQLGLARWLVVGHSWGSDLGLRYAVDHPESVAGLVGIAGHGLHKDRTWSAVYQAGKGSDDAPDIPYEREVWQALQDSFLAWIHEPTLWRSIADCPVPMRFLAAGDDIRPDWPLRQLAELAPAGEFAVVPGVPHDLWHVDPALWRAVVGDACRSLG